VCKTGVPKGGETELRQISNIRNLDQYEKLLYLLTGVVENSFNFFIVAIHRKRDQSNFSLSMVNAISLGCLIRPRTGYFLKCSF